MMTKFLTFSFTMLILMFSGNASASCGDKHLKVGKTNVDVANHIFEKADTNNDGILTSIEHAEAGLEKFGSKFNVFDTNNDGKVTLKEYRTIYNQFHKTPKS